MQGISDVELGLNAPYAANEISLPTPAKDACCAPNCAAVTSRPMPLVMFGPVPAGCRTLAGSPCSVTGESAAAATSTTPCAAAYSSARTSDSGAGEGGAHGSGPKLIFSAPT